MTLALVGTPLAAAPSIVAPGATGLILEIGKGRLIRLDRPAASVFIANPRVADVAVKSPSLIYVTGMAAGETTLFAVDGANTMLVNMGVSVRYDAEQLGAALKRLLPGRAITIDTANDALVLSGTVASAAEGDDALRIAARFVPAKTDAEPDGRIINHLLVDAPNQVNLRVRIAEVSRDVLRQFGFNWSAAGTVGKFALGLATGNPVLGAAGGFATRQNGVDNLFASFRNGDVDLNLLVDALDKNGLVTMLAEPNLTAISGVPAHFLAGGEYPIPVPQGQNVTTIEYKKFGVSLSFVATIADGGRINLNVKPEVSQLSSTGAIVLDGITVPALTTRRAETTVDLGSGQSFAIAGLIQNNVSNDLRKFPGLGDIPILGALFKSRRFARSETELVIIVTPYLVRPTALSRLSTPGGAKP